MDPVMAAVNIALLMKTSCFLKMDSNLQIQERGTFFARQQDSSPFTFIMNKNFLQPPQ